MREVCSINLLFPVLNERLRLQSGIERTMSYLKENGIPCGAYYPRPVNTQTAYAKWNTRSLPVCERLSKTALSIPMTPYLDNEDLDYVIARMNEFAARKMSRAA